MLCSKLHKLISQHIRHFNKFQQWFWFRSTFPQNSSLVYNSPFLRKLLCHPRSSWSHNPESIVFLAHTQPTSEFSLGYISHWRTELTEVCDCHSSATGLPNMGQMSGVTPSTCHSLCRHSSWHFELHNHSPKCVCRLFSFFFMMLFFFLLNTNVTWHTMCRPLLWRVLACISKSDNVYNVHIQGLQKAHQQHNILYFMLFTDLWIPLRDNPIAHLHFLLSFSSHFLSQEAYSHHQRTLFTRNCGKQGVFFFCSNAHYLDTKSRWWSV